MKTINRELIKNLVDSNADNAVIAIVEGVRVLGLKYGWSLEEMQEVGAFASDIRRAAIEGTIEVAQASLESVRP